MNNNSTSDGAFHIEEIEGVVKIQLETHDVPQFHGGLDDSTNKIPVDSVYHRIAKRPALHDLPSLRSKDDAVNFSSQAVQEAYMKLYHGDCILDCPYGQGAVVGGGHSNKIGSIVNIIASVDHNDASTCNDSSFFSGELIGIKFEVENEGDNCGVSIGSLDTPVGQKFLKSLTQRQRVALTRRVLHLFLRTCGACVSKVLRDGVYFYLQEEYLQGKYWKENLDLSVIGADLSFNTTNGLDSRILTLVRLGEALEYVGKFQQAAEMYVELIEKYWEGAQNKSPTKYRATQVHKFAALAYQKGGDYQGAEKYFVSALQYDLIRHGGSWANPDESTANLFADFMSMYVSAQKNEANEKAISEVDASVETTLGVLACMAGIGLNEDYIQNYKDITNQLKPMYYKPKKAREALMSAIASPCNVINFRSKLLMCCTKTGKSVVRGHNPNATTSRRAGKENARKVARKIYPNAGASTCKLHCSACGTFKESSELQWCPCKTVFYCQRECQLAHWKEHKKLCTVRQKKMAS